MKSNSPPPRNNPLLKPKVKNQPSQYLESILADKAFIEHCRHLSDNNEFFLLLNAVELTFKKKFPLNSSLPEYIFRHNQSVREAATAYTQTIIDIILTEIRKEKTINELELSTD